MPGQRLRWSLVGAGAVVLVLAVSAALAGSSGPVASSADFQRDPPTGNTITTLDNHVDQWTSATIGSDDLGLISYFDYTAGQLQLAHCSDTDCTSATKSTLDGSGSPFTSVVGSYSAIAIGTDGLGLISYYDITNGHLKVAHCSNVLCTTATTTTIDSSPNVGRYTSITIGGDGLGLISYYDATNSDLKVAHCSRVTCSSATTSTIDSAGLVGSYTSIATGVDGLGIVSYYDASHGSLKLATCADAACSSAATGRGFGTRGKFSSIVIGSDGRNLTSYYNTGTSYPPGLYINRFGEDVGVAAGDVGRYNSITIDADSYALVSYYDATNGNLKYLRCTCGPIFGADTKTTIDSTGNVGKYSSITVGTDGLPLISYYDETNHSLKVAHCANVFCSPNFRRR
jgi:hypothetical protein